ncbi:MAG: histone deacetylase, partial [Desulforhopalus sp.]
MKSKVGFLVDDRYLDHAISRPSPENPERIRALASIVKEQYSKKCMMFPARTALSADIEAVHSPFYLQQLREHVLRPDPYSYDRDTY